MAAPTIKLNSGYDMPVIAFGTWHVPEAEVVDIIAYAINEGGYRHIDCAWGYLNEKGVGEGIKKSGINREELFLTSKVWGTYHSRVEESLDETLAALGTDYVDLFLMHWPVPLNPKASDNFNPLRPDGSRDVDTTWDIKDTWRQMEALVKKGKARSIGLANFSVPILAPFLIEPSSFINIPPAVIQQEIHPYNPDHALVAFSKAKGMAVMGYSAMDTDENEIVHDEVVAGVAKERGLRGVDVVFGWAVAKNIIPVTLSTTQDNIKRHIEGFVKASQTLTVADIAKLDGIAAAGKQNRVVMPPWGVDLQFDHWPAKSW